MQAVWTRGLRHSAPRSVFSAAQAHINEPDVGNNGSATAGSSLARAASGARAPGHAGRPAVKEATYCLLPDDDFLDEAVVSPACISLGGQFSLCRPAN